jgi:hypothetical protein
MITWIDWTKNGEELHNFPSLETAIKIIFWDTHANTVFRAESRTDLSTVLWLIQTGTEQDWKIYANMQTETGNRFIDCLLDALYPYFNNPNYEWPESGELNSHQQLFYDSITRRLSKTTEFIGVSAMIPDVQARVGSGIAGRWNTNPWISIILKIEDHGSKPKK